MFNLAVVAQAFLLLCRNLFSQLLGGLTKLRPATDNLLLHMQQKVAAFARVKRCDACGSNLRAILQSSFPACGLGGLPTAGPDSRLESLATRRQECLRYEIASRPRSWSSSFSLPGHAQAWTPTLDF